MRISSSAPPLLALPLLLLAAGQEAKTSETLFPWAEKPLPPQEVVREALARGCPRNTSGGGYVDIYGSFADIVQDKKSLYNYRLSEVLLTSLIARGRSWNRHLLACPFAVWKAIQLWSLVHMRQASATMSDPELWSSGWHEVRHAMRVWTKLDSLIDCSTCEPGWHDRVDRALQPFGGRGGSHWIWDEVKKHTSNLKDEIATPQKSQHRWTGNFSEDEHASFLRDSKTLLDEIRSQGFMKDWVITHGTMVNALRYGSNRAAQLPSGHLESDASKTFDMDVYVLTDAWDTMCRELTSYAKEHLGFNWCGWVKGWPKMSMQCWRGEGELEIHNIDKRVSDNNAPLPPHPISLSMVPPSRCLGAHDLELPCPRDPLVFMQYIWRERPHYTACLPLPMSRQKTADDITKEDVRYFWEQSLTLHERGFMNMAPYFGTCTEHPLAEYAQSLYWGMWVLT